MPDAAGKRLPPGLQRLLEREVQLEHVPLSVVILDDFEKRNVRYLLHTTQGEVSVFFTGKHAMPHLFSGMRVTVRGRQLGHNLIVDLGIPGSLVVEEGGTDGSSGSGGAPGGSGGPSVKQVAVILMNLESNPVQPYDREHARGVTFVNTDGSDAYYREVSFDQWALEGYYDPEGERDVYGWYTIACSDTNKDLPACTTSCDWTAWGKAAEAKATADGFVRANYRVVMHAWPKHSACGWWGLAYLDGTDSYVNGDYKTHVVVHELGHNFVWHHASTYRCTDTNGQPVSLSGNCSFSEYGDPFSVMGGGSTKATHHANNYQKGEIGWLRPENTLDVTTDGFYDITPIERASTGVQSLRILRQDPKDGRDRYYLEFRQPHGVFDNFSPTDAVVNGVSIRMGKDYAVAGERRPFLWSHLAGSTIRRRRRPPCGQDRQSPGHSSALPLPTKRPWVPMSSPRLRPT